MGASGVELADLTPTVLEEFLRARAAEGYVTKLTKHGLTPLVEYLEELALYMTPAASMTGVDRLVGRFRGTWWRSTGWATPPLPTTSGWHDGSLVFGLRRSR